VEPIFDGIGAVVHGTAVGTGLGINPNAVVPQFQRGEFGEGLPLQLRQQSRHIDGGGVRSAVSQSHGHVVKAGVFTTETSRPQEAGSS
jgi:hypothetical protein